RTLEFPATGDFATVSTGAHGKPPVTCSLKGEVLVTDIAALHGSRWPWQQLLRAIAPHRGLRKLILIGSKHGTETDKPGSFALLADCGKLLGRYLPAGCEVHLHPEALAFEDFNEVKRSLRGIISAEVRVAGEGAIAIDVTGGQATTSIAAAAATIGSEAIFQY